MTDDATGVVELLAACVVPRGMLRNHPIRTIFIGALGSTVARPSETASFAFHGAFTPEKREVSQGVGDLLRRHRGVGKHACA